jgi:hypothetical protein
MATLVTGLFNSRSGADPAVEGPVDYGDSRDDIITSPVRCSRGCKLTLQAATKSGASIDSESTKRIHNKTMEVTKDE